MTVWAGMTTLLERAGSRAMAIESLLPQVDRLIVTPGDGIGDQAKFAAAADAPGIFFTVDDDLIYPPDYVETTLAWLDEFPGCIVSYHGFTIDENGGRVDSYRCLDAVEEPVEVHVAGTGVCAFDTATIRPTPEDFPIPGGADPWFSLLAERSGVRRLVVPHPARWFGYTEWRRTMWTETAAETGSTLDGSAAMRAACEELAALIHGVRA